MDPRKAAVTLLFLIVLIQSSNTTDLKPNIPSKVQISSNDTVELRVDSIPRDITHVVCQVHTHKDALTLSLTPKATKGTHELGLDVGVAHVLVTGQKTVTWYLMSNHGYDVEALVTVTLYQWTDPIPGGCNVEFNFENDPNFHLTFDSSKTLMLYQWSSHGRNRSVIPNPNACEKLTRPLRYDLYVYYLPGNDWTLQKYFDGIKKMMTVESILQYGRKITRLKDDKTSVRSKFTIASYTGQGSIYNIIVTDVAMGTTARAAYIPSTTYSCDLHNTDSCQAIGVGGKVLAVLGGAVGLFLLLLGHRYFKTSVFVTSFLAMGIISVILLERYTTQSIAVVLVLSAVLGVVLATGWLTFWWYHGIPSIPVLLNGLTAGYVISSIVFYTPLGNLDYWNRAFNYGMSFTVGVLIIPVILLFFTKTLSIVSCTFLGGYLVCVAVDVLLGSGFKYIILNSIRHATDDYLTVIVTGPYLTADIWLTALWAVLFVGGTVFQYYREWGKQDFPESTRKTRRQSRPTDIEEERQSLLGNNQPTLYSQPGSVGVNGSHNELHVPVS